MAVVKHNYIRQDKSAGGKAKKFIRYMEQRSGKDGARIIRTLFDSGGTLTRQDAFRMIEGAEPGGVFFRMVISPDPVKEDRERDLSLREVVERTMLKFAEHTQRDIQWVAAVHNDHAPHRHLHVLALVNWKLPAQVFSQLPQVLRSAATEACLEQRHELDLTMERQSEKREEAQWERER
jgi:hypothetical protein